MNILIGSNGGLTGIYLAKTLSKIKDAAVFGADSSEVNPGKFFVSKQFLLPKALDINFLDQLIFLLNDEKIDYYFPTHSMETKIVSKYANQLTERCNCKFMVSPYSTFEALDSKCISNRNLAENGIPVPKEIEDLDCEYPIIMKRNIGSGGSGKQIIDNGRLHVAYCECSKDVSFYEYIEGTEYTVDCLFGYNGELIVCNQRIREKTIAGAVSISRTCNDFDIKPWINKISSIWKFCGCVNFQFILRNNVPYFIDINLRFPSGGLPVTVEQGYNIPQMMVDIMDGKKMDIPVVNSNNIRMYRYFEEIFEEL